MVDQWQAAGEKTGGPLDLKADQVAEAFVFGQLREVFGGPGKSSEILARDVAASPFPVAVQVLPKVRQLQARADRVGPGELLGVILGGQAEQDTADRIGRAATVIEDFLKRFVMRLPLVLAERVGQIGKGLLREFKLTDRLGQRDQDRVLRLPSKAGVQFRLPGVESLEGDLRRGGFVGQIVRGPAVRIDVVEGLTIATGQKNRPHQKVFIVAAGDPPTQFFSSRQVGRRSSGAGAHSRRDGWWRSWHFIKVFPEKYVRQPVLADGLGVPSLPRLTYSGQSEARFPDNPFWTILPVGEER